VAYEAKVMGEGLRQIREMIKETEGKIQELCEQFPEYPRVLMIPGFGPDVSAKVFRSHRDPNRFQNGKQVLKEAGLDLRADPRSFKAREPSSQMRIRNGIRRENCSPKSERFYNLLVL